MIIISFAFAFVAVLVISYWAGKFTGGLSGIGMLITGVVAFIAACLFQLFAPEYLVTPVAAVFLGIVMLTLIVNWISGK